MRSLLLGLDDNTLACVLLQLMQVKPEPQQLLLLSRTCSRLHAAVHGCDAAWQQLYTSTYPKAAATQPPTTALPCYRELFKERWIRDARELRLQRKVQRMRLQSDAAQLQRELHQLQGQLQAERRTQQSLDQQLWELQRARLAHNASQSGWQLGAVQLYHNRVVQATPVTVEAKLVDLQQQQKVSRLQSQTLKASIDLRRQRLADTKRRLAAHEG